MSSGSATVASIGCISRHGIGGRLCHAYARRMKEFIIYQNEKITKQDMEEP